ncbi:leucine-rich repeat protein lrrA-like isoform X1 [Cardiocondyla obscurior]|uniref:leucine-rich repeat protein lrrA-like isoform X1 n=1 Tax=Cardiocondyla obscurior TaxID=286306 RepID=UPI00396583A1
MVAMQLLFFLRVPPVLLNMSKDIAESLLTRYYGISKDQKAKTLPSIQECLDNGKNECDKLICEQSTVERNDNGISEGTRVQENDIENEKKSSKVNTLARSSRALEWENLDNEEISSKFDDILELNTSNLYENTYISPDEKTYNLAICGKPTSTSLGLEDTEGNDSYLSLSEDALLDSASDVSSTVGNKKLQTAAITFIPPSTPPPSRTSVYNKQFIDLTNTGLTVLPIETIEKYSTIQMLYLENNNLSELPEKLFVALQHLQWLDVRNNLLTSLPTSIKSHSSLETILLQGNKIEKLPLELCLVPNLKILNVAHNPIVVPPKDIIALGFFSILSYLRSEWNKLHPNKPITFVKQKIEPQASTILCYRSPRKKQWKLSKCSRQISKGTNDVDNGPFNDSMIGRKSRVNKP